MLQCHATAHGEEDGTSQSNYLMIGNITKSDRPLTERLLLILIILFFIITFFFVLIPIFFIYLPSVLLLSLLLMYST